MTGAVVAVASLGSRQMYQGAASASASATGSFINVRDYGAMGDGSTDDTQAIQAAIDATEGVGGIVFVPPGIYVVSDSILLHVDNLTLAGAGSGATVLRLVERFDKDLVGIVRTLPGRINRHITVMDLTIDGNRDNQNSGAQFGFYCGVSPSEPDSDEDIICTRVEIHQCTGYGFDSNEMVARLHFTDCLSHHNGLDGFTLDGVVMGIVQGCIAHDNDRHGFNLITGSYYCNLSENIAYNNGGNGFTLQNRAIANTINNNIVYHNGLDGIYGVGVQENIIQNNHVFENERYGIRIRGCPYTTINSNRLRNNTQEAHETYDEIQVSDDSSIGSFQCMIASNHVTCTGRRRARYGIHEPPGENSALQDKNVYTGNKVSGAVRADYQVEGSNAVQAANG